MNKYRVTYTAGGETKENGWTEPLKTVTVEADDFGTGNPTHINDNGTLTIFFDRENERWAVYTNVRVIKRLS